MLSQTGLSTPSDMTANTPLTIAITDQGNVPRVELDLLYRELAEVRKAAEVATVQVRSHWACMQHGALQCVSV